MRRAPVRNRAAALGPNDRRPRGILRGLSARPPHRRAAHHNRRSAPVIAHRQPLVIRQQRIVRPQHLADVGGVVNRCVEIGVIADLARQQHPRAGHRRQQRFRARLAALQKCAECAGADRARAGAGIAITSFIDAMPKAAVASRIRSPIATPSCALPLVSNVPNGRFSRGKSHAGSLADSTQLYVHGSNPSTRRSPIGSSNEHEPKLCAKLRRASAICSVESVRPRHSRAFAPKENASASVSFSVSKRCLALGPMPRERRRHEHIQEPMHHGARTIGRVSQRPHRTHRMMQSRGGFEGKLARPPLSPENRQDRPAVESLRESIRRCAPLRTRRRSRPIGAFAICRQRKPPRALRFERFHLWRQRPGLIVDQQRDRASRQERLR